MSCLVVYLDTFRLILTLLVTLPVLGCLLFEIVMHCSCPVHFNKLYAQIAPLKITQKLIVIIGAFGLVIGLMMISHDAIKKYYYLKDVPIVTLTEKALYLYNLRSIPWDQVLEAKVRQQGRKTYLCIISKNNLQSETLDNLGISLFAIEDNCACTSQSLSMSYTDIVSAINRNKKV